MGAKTVPPHKGYRNQLRVKGVLAVNMQAEAMGADSENTILRRKVDLGHTAHQARAMSVQKALRLCLAKVAERQMALALLAIGITQNTLTQDELAAEIAAEDLLVLLDGPQGRRGAVTLDASFVTGLIQQQTMGSVTESTQTGARKMTATDAAMCAPMLDALFEMAAPMPEDQQERDLLDGFRFGARADEPRLLLLALEASEYAVYRLTVDIAGGQRQGKMTLLLPMDETPDPDFTPPSDDADRDSAPNSATLEAAVLATNAHLMIALCKQRMPLSQICNFEVGQTLLLKDATFDRAMALTAQGRRLGVGTLGQVEGYRALRLDLRADAPDMPRRRAGDRAEVAQTEVAREAAQTEFAPQGAPVETAKPANVHISDSVDVPDMSDVLPDMSDLPGLDDLQNFESLPDTAPRTKISVA